MSFGAEIDRVIDRLRSCDVNIERHVISISGHVMRVMGVFVKRE